MVLDPIVPQIILKKIIKLHDMHALLSLNFHAPNKYILINFMSTTTNLIGCIEPIKHDRRDGIVITHLSENPPMLLI